MRLLQSFPLNFLFKICLHGLLQNTEISFFLYVHTLDENLYFQIKCKLNILVTICSNYTPRKQVFRWYFLLVNRSDEVVSQLNCTFLIKILLIYFSQLLKTLLMTSHFFIMNSENSDFIEALACLYLPFVPFKAEEVQISLQTQATPCFSYFLSSFFILFLVLDLVSFCWGIFEKKSPEQHGGFITFFRLVLRVDAQRSTLEKVIVQNPSLLPVPRAYLSNRSSFVRNVYSKD